VTAREVDAIDAVAARRWAWVEVDLTAIADNVRHLRSVVAPAQVWAVVKANAYGHGAVAVAGAALRAGARGLCVALPQEGAELRAAGIRAPVLLLSEPPTEQMDDVVALDLTPTLYSIAGVEGFAAAVRQMRPPVDEAVPVHVMVDTGMHRVGVEPGAVGALLACVARHAELRVDAAYTHFATADEARADEAGADGPSQQLARLRAAVVGTDVEVLHAANSAGALAHPDTRLALVRVGIAMYGLTPGRGVRELMSGLRPALGLHARVSHVQRLSADEAVSYGWRYRLARDATVATLPIGYADGVARRLFDTGGQMLVGGRRCPIAGSVTMDQVMLDCGDDAVAVGDAAVLIGRQGDQAVTAEEWADRLGTIPYEIVCAISPRVPRRYVDRADANGATSAGAH